MNNKKFNLEGILYLLAFSIAVFLRLYRLGYFPLGNNEADLALSALGSLQRSDSTVYPQTGYTLFTHALFWMFGTTNFCARLLPAVTGSLLALAPILYRGIIGRTPALILAFGLALDPSLIELSRTAGTGALALSFFVLSFGFLLDRKPRAAWISLAIAVLGGVDFWHGLLIILLTWGFISLLSRSSESLILENQQIDLFRVRGKFLASFVVALILLGTLFLSQPGGLGGILTSLSTYFYDWVRSEPTTGVGQMLISLVSYELFPLFFGLFGLFFTSYPPRLKQTRTVCILLFSGFTLSLIYPGREGVDLVWVIVPLWVLASYGIKRFLLLLSKQNRVVNIFTGFISVILFFVALNVLGLSNQVPSSADFQTRLAIIGGAAIVLGLLVTLLAWGWSPGLGLSSLLSAVFVILFLLNYSSAWRSARLGAHPNAEIWFSGSSFPDADLFEETLSQISIFNTGDRFVSTIVVMEPAPAAIVWVLRNRSGVDFQTVIDKQAAPDMVITKTMDLPSLNSSYTGQEFYLDAPANISFTQPMTWLKWVIYRKIEQEKTPIFLWVRSDIFPGSVSDKQ